MQNTTLAGRYRQQSPPEEGFVVWLGCLTMTYFRTGYPHYHRRCLVSRSCSGWEGVGPRRYGRQTESGGRKKSSGKRGLIARVTAVKARSRGGRRSPVALLYFAPLRLLIVIGSSRTGN